MMSKILNQKNIHVLLKIIAGFILFIDFFGKIPNLFLAIYAKGVLGFSPGFYFFNAFLFFALISCVAIFFKKKWAWIGVSSWIAFSLLLSIDYFVRQGSDTSYGGIFLNLSLMFNIISCIIFWSFSALKFLEIEKKQIALSMIILVIGIAFRFL